MQALYLSQKLNASQIQYPTGSKLGEGADGEVYEISNDSTKVIKFGVFYERERAFDLVGLNKMFHYMINNSVMGLGRVFDFHYLGESIREVYRGQQKYYLYYYVMEKLNRISEDESKVFHTILSHEDRNINKNYSPDELQEILKGLSYGLDFDFDKVKDFYSTLQTCPIYHSDIHSRNIMKTNSNDFKLIDFDRSYLR
jgi:hypothetical protein